jgi:hypothetical protein
MEGGDSILEMIIQKILSGCIAPMSSQASKSWLIEMKAGE